LGGRGSAGLAFAQTGRPIPAGCNTDDSAVFGSAESDIGSAKAEQSEAKTVVVAALYERRFCVWAPSATVTDRRYSEA